MYLFGIDGKPLKLQGLAVPYNTPIMLNDEPDSFAPGCYAHQTARNFCGDDVCLVQEHIEQAILGNTRHCTLELFDTDAGLLYSVALPANPAGEGMAALARLGVLGASVQNTWENKNGRGVVLNAHLEHVGITRIPAYTETVGASWLSDMKPHQMSRAARQWRTKFNLASMRDRVCGIADSDAGGHETRPARSRNQARPSPAAGTPFSAGDDGTARRSSSERGASQQAAKSGSDLRAPRMAGDDAETRRALDRALSAKTPKSRRQQQIADAEFEQQLAEDLGLTLEELRAFRRMERDAARHMSDRAA